MTTINSESQPGHVTGYDRGFLLHLYERMVLIREFEERVKFLFLEGTMPGTIHQCQGQEATAVGVCAALREEDFITSTFRGHGHALAKGLSVQELLDELFGASTGCCKGKGGSMHVGNMTKGMIPAIAIVGGGIPLAAGMALAFKMRKSKQVVACFFGDGAVAEGAFHEGLNMAAIWNLPVVFVCENNLYGASTRVDKVMMQHEDLRPCRQLRHSRRDGRRQRRAGRLRSDPKGGGRMPRRQRPGVAGTADLPAHRPLATRSLPLPGRRRAETMVQPGSHRSLPQGSDRESNRFHRPNSMRSKREWMTKLPPAW